MSNLLMSLKFRKNLSQVVEVTNTYQSKTDDDEVKHNKQSTFWWGRRLVMAASLLLPCFALLLLCASIMRSSAPSKVSPRLSRSFLVSSGVQPKSSPESRTASPSLTIPIDQSAKVELSMDQFVGSKDSSGNATVSMGPHSVVVVNSLQDCTTSARLKLRFQGDALVSIPLQLNQQNRLSGSFYFPIPGHFQLEVRWFECGSTAEQEQTKSLPLSLTVTNQGTASVMASQSTKPYFIKGYWLHKKHLTYESIKSDYVWVPFKEQYSTPDLSKFYQASSPHGKATVAMEGNPISINMFSKLSNYEVVCWIGNSDASRQTFLSLRQQISPNQRPFKFHYYPFTTLDQSSTDRRPSRKCKHSIVSVDELDTGGISQDEYRTKIMKLLLEISKCMHDDTWNIWMLTVSPLSRLCNTTTTTIPTSHHHPCNQVLMDMFCNNSTANTLPNNVYLLDNTDIAEPQWHDEAAVTATIAMRLYVLIAKGVEIWRRMGQVGRIDGLHRNGKVENDAADVCTFDMS